jgi:hypothetical protein
LGKEIEKEIAADIKCIIDKNHLKACMPRDTLSNFINLETVLRLLYTRCKEAGKENLFFEHNFGVEWCSLFAGRMGLPAFIASRRNTTFFPQNKPQQTKRYFKSVCVIECLTFLWQR